LRKNAPVVLILGAVRRSANGRRTVAKFFSLYYTPSVAARFDGFWRFCGKRGKQAFLRTDAKRKRKGKKKKNAVRRLEKVERTTFEKRRVF